LIFLFKLLIYGNGNSKGIDFINCSESSWFDTDLKQLVKQILEYVTFVLFDSTIGISIIKVGPAVHIRSSMHSGKIILVLSDVGYA
jgi:hypothetical protein